MLGLLGFLGAACSSGGGGAGGGGGGGGMTGLGPEGEPAPAWASEIALTETCTRTMCEKSYDSCEAQIDECFSTCSSMLEYASQCISVCMDMECTPCGASSSNSCADYSFSFELQKPPDPQLLAACKAAVARDTSCGESNVLSNCEHYARIEDPKNAPAYTCLAGLACGQDAASCFDSIEPSPAAEEYVQAFNDVCAGQSELDVEQTEALAHQFGWLKTPLTDALVDCTDYSCDNAYACQAAWFSVVYPEG